jgi:hypothetical protein
LSGLKLVKRGCSVAPGKGAAWMDSTAFVEISVDGAGRSHAAFGRRPEAAAYLLDFLTSQITSAPANQHSVLIVHGVFSFHH